MDDEEYEELSAKELEKLRDKENNVDNIRNAADVASASGNGVAMAIGGAVNTADTLTNGGSTEVLADVVRGANKLAPGAQDLLNDLAESGASDAAGRAARAKNAASGDGANEAADAANKAGNTANNVNNAANAANQANQAANGVNGANGANGTTPNQVRRNGEVGGEQNGSLPSSGDKNVQPGQAGGTSESSEESTSTGGKKSARRRAAEDEEDNKSMSNPFDFKIGFVGKSILLSLAPIFLSLFPIFLIMMVILGVVSNFTDGLGVDSLEGNDINDIVFSAESEDQEKFYNRVLEVKTEYALKGMTVDPLKVVATYHVLRERGAAITYDSMTKENIRDVVECMFLYGVYSDAVFKSNLITYLIPKYLPDTLDDERVSIAESVFAYIENYYKFLGKETKKCDSIGSCTYIIKGFYITNSNIKKDMTVNDLYVRLMQCGPYNGYNPGGTFGKALDGEELVPFEKYILGVAYQEIGPSAPEEAFKAQMIAARSYILARPTQMGGWRTLKQESGGKWVLQVAACTADQVYCDPDKGCSTIAGGNGQAYQVYSGTTHGRVLKNPLPQDSKLRQYAADVQGEVLINSQGNIVLTDYTDVESKKFTSLANEGFSYQQIIMQVYNQKYPKAGISDIYKASCGNCVSTGEYAKWKQYEGEWVNVGIGNSGKTIKQIGCLVTSLAIQVAKSGVPTNVNNFNPGTFVEALNKQGAFGDGGALLSYASVEKVAPTFKYQGYIDVKGMGKTEKLNAIKNIVNQKGVYAVAEVKGNTGQHWVAIDSISGDKINMMDPGSSSTDMWDEYNWNNTSRIVYYKVG